MPQRQAASLGKGHHSMTHWSVPPSSIYTSFDYLLSLVNSLQSCGCDSPTVVFVTEIVIIIVPKCLNLRTVNSSCSPNSNNPCIFCEFVHIHNFEILSKNLKSAKLLCICLLVCCRISSAILKNERNWIFGLFDAIRVIIMT